MATTLPPALRHLSPLPRLQTVFSHSVADGLNLLNRDAQLIEQFGAIDGLPPNTQAVTVLDNKIYLTFDSTTIDSTNIDAVIMEFNAHSLELKPAQIAPKALKDMRQAAMPLPESLQKTLKEQSSGPSISLETLILDLHSGRFFGQFGVLFIDLIGLLVCILSITGLMAGSSAARLSRVKTVIQRCQLK